MTLLNFMSKSWISHSYDRWGESVSDWTYEESHPNVWDGDWNTYFGLYAHHGGDGHVRAQFWSTHTWDKPKYIYRVKGRYRHQSYGGNYKGGWHTLIVKLLIDGSWTEIYNQHWDTGGGGSNNWNAWWTHDFDLTTGWDNVTGVQIWADGYSNSYEGDRRQDIRHRFHELEVYREAYEELFRVQGPNGLIRVGGVDLKSTSKARVMTPNGVKELPLLDLDDPEAVPIRIYTPAGAKAIPYAEL